MKPRSAPELGRWAALLMRRQVLVFVPASLIAAMLFAPAHADDECKASFVPPPGVQCTDPNAAQFDFNCAMVWDEIEDCRLNRTYEKLISVLRSESKQLANLRTSQRAWIQFRDADVALVVSHYGEGGSLGRSIASLHRFRLTRERLRELQKRLSDSGRW